MASKVEEKNICRQKMFHLYTLDRINANNFRIKSDLYVILVFLQVWGRIKKGREWGL